MNLRQKWDAIYASRGHMRLNIFDPDMITEEDQIKMFGEILSSKSRKKKEPDIDPDGISSKLLDKVKNLPGNEREEIIKQLTNG